MNRVLLGLGALLVVAALVWALWSPAPPPAPAVAVAPTVKPTTRPAGASTEVPAAPDPPRRVVKTDPVAPPPAAQLDPPIPQDRGGLRRLTAVQAPPAPGVGDTMNPNTPPPAPGTIGPAAIREAIQQAAPAIAGCYDQILERRPDAAGTLKVQFRLVAKAGVARLKDAEIMEDSLGDPFLGMCALKAIADLTFEAQADGEVTVHYPFVLEPSEGDDSEDTQDEADP